MNRKILLPLATVLAAGAIAVGSGATFDSTSSNSVSAVTSGTLTQSNSKANQAIFTLTDMKPGDVVNGSLTLTNTGSLPATFSLTEVSSNNAFGGANPGDDLKLDIVDTTANTTVYTGTFGGLVNGVKNTLGDWPAGAVHNFKFTVTLVSTAPNTDQGKTADAVYRWDSVQLAASTYNQ